VPARRHDGRVLPVVGLQARRAAVVVVLRGAGGTRGTREGGPVPSPRPGGGLGSRPPGTAPAPPPPHPLHRPGPGARSPCSPPPGARRWRRARGGGPSRPRSRRGARTGRPRRRRRPPAAPATGPSGASPGGRATRGGGAGSGGGRRPPRRPRRRARPGSPGARGGAAPPRGRPPGCPSPSPPAPARGAGGRERRRRERWGRERWRRGGAGGSRGRPRRAGARWGLTGGTQRRSVTFVFAPLSGVDGSGEPGPLLRSSSALKSLRLGGGARRCGCGQDSPGTSGSGEPVVKITRSAIDGAESGGGGRGRSLRAPSRFGTGRPGTAPRGGERPRIASSSARRGMTRCSAERKAKGDEGGAARAGEAQSGSRCTLPCAPVPRAPPSGDGVALEFGSLVKNRFYQASERIAGARVAAPCRSGRGGAARASLRLWRARRFGVRALTRHFPTATGCLWVSSSRIPCTSCTNSRVT